MKCGTWIGRLFVLIIANMISLTGRADISGSQLISLDNYVSGVTNRIRFLMTAVSPDDEWIVEISVKFPVDVEVITGYSDPGYQPGSLYAVAEWTGSTMEYGGVASWSTGEAGYRDGEWVVLECDVYVPPSVYGDGQLPYTLTGDNYGNPPPTLLDGSVSVYWEPQFLIYYVDPNGSHTPPFESWATAATNIQAAVDLAVDGDLVTVSNGVYGSGRRHPAGFDSWARVVITNDIVVRSVAGYGETLIVGAPDPLTGGAGSNAVRGVYLSAGTLSGFTVSNGYAAVSGVWPADERNGGGVFMTGGRVEDGLVTGCTAAEEGGGVFATGGVVADTDVTGNVAGGDGGGVYLSGSGTVLTNVWVLDNRADGNGGGCAADAAALIQGVTVSGNTSSHAAGGVSLLAGATLDFSSVRYNRALAGNGGGICSDGGNVWNSLVANNNARAAAGGVEASFSTLRNVSILGNRATTSAGGLLDLGDNAILNSIVHHNRAPWAPNWRSGQEGGASTYRFCAMDPVPGSGEGHLSGAPRVAGVSDPHLLTNSPCINMGENGSAAGVADIDGEVRVLSTVDIGCDELHVAGLWPGAPWWISVEVEGTNVVPGQALECRGDAFGPVTASRWSFGDGSSTSDLAVVQHAWSTPGVYEIVYAVLNDDTPAGLSATTTVTVTSWSTNYVSPAGTHLAPYTNWVTAATNIQAAVDAAPYGGTTLVADGVYATGGRAVPGTVLTNRVCLEKRVSVVALNDQGATIEGDLSAPVRCAYLVEGASLTGFRLRQGAALPNETLLDADGGGVYLAGGGTLTRCLVEACHARGGDGGGIFMLGGGELLASTVGRCTATNGPASQGGNGGGVALLSGGVVDGTEIEACEAWLGGGIYLDRGGALSQVRVHGNLADDGGGIYATGSGEVSDSQVHDNTAGGRGGGISAGWGTVTLRDSLVISNTVTAGLGGGGLALSAGGEAIRCRILGNSSGGTGGGGVLLDEGGVVDTCLVATNTAALGGGVYVHHNGRVVSSTVCANTATAAGGGLYAADAVAGAGKLHDCLFSVLYDNQAPAATNWGYGGINIGYTNVCAAPLPPGTGNASARPGFIPGSYLPGYGSVCLDAGLNAFSASGTDLDGRTRPLDGTFDAITWHDMGAYEYRPGDSDTDGDGMTDEWEHGNYPATVATNADADVDYDGDTMDNYSELVADTAPGDSNSVFRVLSIAAGSPAEIVASTAATRWYTLQYAPDLQGSSWSNVVGQMLRPGTGSPMLFEDTSPAAGSRMYRVKVYMPEP